MGEREKERMRLNGADVEGTVMVGFEIPRGPWSIKNEQSFWKIVIYAMYYICILPS